MIQQVLEDLRSVKSSPDLFFVRFALKSVGKPKSAITATNYSVKDALKIGYN